MDEHPAVERIINHGYNAYSKGLCKCSICREAKRVRQLEYRTFHRNNRLAHSGPGLYIAPNITHGIGGYTYFSCRCRTCTAAKRQADLRNKKWQQP